MIWKKLAEIQDKEVKYYVLLEAELENWDKLTKKKYCKNGSGCCSLTQKRDILAKMKGNTLGCLRKIQVFKIQVFKTDKDLSKSHVCF